MIYWVLYDISDFNQRNRLVQILKDHGLTRRQKSAFLRELTQGDRKSLGQELKVLFKANRSKETDSVFIIPCCHSCFQKLSGLGKSPPLLDEFKSTTLIL